MLKVLAEENHLRKYNTPNNNNWRNAFITLSGLGLLNEKNLLTAAGRDFAKYDYFKFSYIIFMSYIKPYFDVLFPILKENPHFSLSEVNSRILNKFDQRQVLFLTESENRYLSSWFGIFRDDYGFIDFEPRKTNRKVNYDPSGLDEYSFIENMKRFTKATRYIEEFN